jgi:Molybdopterin-binding domain of aldehyde dehydrogenase
MGFTPSQRHAICDRQAPQPLLESAMDDLAVVLKLDPLDLRLRCYSERDQNNGRPFSSKELRECYHQGAVAFGGDNRRSMRDGADLVGFGMAMGIWEAVQMPIAVRIVLTADGHAEVSVCHLRYRYRHLYHHGAGRGGHARRRLKPAAAAAILGVSRTHLRRLRAQCASKGASGLVSQRRLLGLDIAMASDPRSTADAGVAWLAEQVRKHADHLRAG